MPASFPSSAKSFVTREIGDTIAASHVNDLQLEVAAIESDLLNATPTFLSTVTSGINATALSTGTVPLARLDANVILTTSTTGINATALSTGTVANARLDSNIIFTTSTTGINATALSTGTVPLARLDANVILTSSTTGINATALSAGTIPDGRIVGAYTGVTSLAVGANVSMNTTTLLIGNSTVNTVMTATTVTINGASVATTGKAIAMAMVFGG